MARLAALRQRYGAVELAGSGGGCVQASEPSLSFCGDGPRTDDADGELRAAMAAVLVWLA